MNIKPIKNFTRLFQPPADKSIMQRAIILGFLAGGIKINNPSFCQDAISSLDCIKELGADCYMESGSLIIKGGKESKAKILNAGNSATALRLLLGLALGKGLEVTITGDKSLQNRSLKDTLEALQKMGARFESNGCHAPIKVLPSRISGSTIYIDRPSAQIKSALMIAGLFANQKSTIYEKVLTRDHTERMLYTMGANIEFDQTCSSLNSNEEYKNKIEIYPSFLKEIEVTIPGDISSAAYMIAMAALVPNGYVAIKNCGLNKSRLGMVDVLKSAGLDITIINKGESGLEPYGDIIVKNSPFSGIKITAEMLPTLIDEVPILAVLACFASGESYFYGLNALKNKESDRLLATYKALKEYGADIKLCGDSLLIKGGVKPKKIVIDSDDHRMIMALSVAAAVGAGGVVKNPDAVSISYPTFFQDLFF